MTAPAGWPAGRYGAILADPPWRFITRSEKGKGRAAENHYPTMTLAEIAALPVAGLAADDCVLFLWTTGPHLEVAFDIIRAWGFGYKTIGFDWVKVRSGNGGAALFRPPDDAVMGTGYWTRANSEPCLLATAGKPKRLDAGVRQVILEDDVFMATETVLAPRRDHSRKPAGIHGRIEALVGGPRLELFARQRRAGWHAWGNDVDKFQEAS